MTVENREGGGLRAALELPRVSADAPEGVCVTASSLRWPLLALLGLLVAAAIAFLATRAVNTDIGISSEPPTAGRALSPAPPKPPRQRPAATTTSASPPATTVTIPAPAGDDRGEAGDD